MPMFGGALKKTPTYVRSYVAFSLIYASYIVFYFNRKNYAFWLNELVNTVGMSLDRASLFGSTMELSYGVGKLVAGPLVDSIESPSFVLYSVLALSSFCNMAIFNSGIYLIDLGLWCLNGLVQAAAWPALAIIFMNWFKTSPKKGTMYSILSTSQNLGSGSIPIVLTPIVGKYGWQASTLFPGFLGIMMVIVLLLFLEDGPENIVTNQDISKSKPDINWKKSAIELFTSSNFLLLGSGYTFLTIVRVGFADWSLIMLQEVRGILPQDSKNCLVTLELGGFIGGLVIGSISDFLFSGKRTPAMYSLCIILLPVIATIFILPLPEKSMLLIINSAYGLLGFAGFGPHMLVGLLARELYPDLPSTAGSYAKFIGQVGGSFAGYPISLIARGFGWYYVGATLALCAVCAAVSFALVGTPSKPKVT